MTLNDRTVYGLPQPNGALDEDEETDGETDGDGSISDLDTTADPEFFDRTFQLSRDDVPIAVDEAPEIPRPWQGLPRIALVYNFNYVYDDTAEEWVRQHPFSGGGAWEQVDSGTVTITGGGQTTIQHSSLTDIDGFYRPVVTFQAGENPGTDIAVVEAGSSALGDFVQYELRWDNGNSNWSTFITVSGLLDLDLQWRVFEATG